MTQVYAQVNFPIGLSGSLQFWQCQGCGSVIFEREVHDGWHIMVEPPE